MIQHRLRCGLTHVKLGAHLLQARSKRLNCLLLPRDHCYLFLHRLMFFQEPIKQYRVDLFVAQCVRPALPAAFVEITGDYCDPFDFP